MSFFTFKRVAEGYAKYRPYHHPLIMKKIRQCTGLDGKFENALDVGCGTGLSTVGLQEIADHVTGTENSPAMNLIRMTLYSHWMSISILS